MLSVDKLNPYKNLLYLSLRDYKVLDSALENLDLAGKEDLYVLYLYTKDVCFLFGVDEGLKINLKELSDLFENEKFATFIDKFEESEPTLFLQLATLKLVVKSLLTDEETILTSIRLLEVGIAKLIDIQIKKEETIKSFVPDGIADAFKKVNTDG